MAAKAGWLVLAAALGVLACRGARAPREGGGELRATGAAARPAASDGAADGSLAPAADGAAAAAPAPAEPRAIEVRVDPNVELLCVLARLAGFAEYSSPLDTAYARDTQERFAPFAQHDAVKTLRRVRFTSGVSHDAVIGMALHLGELPELAEHGLWDGEGRSLDRRWPLREARRFRAEARRFAAESDFAGFLAQNAALYAESERRFRALLARRDVVAWLDAFFGVPEDMRFRAAPGLLTGGGSYGGTVRLPGGGREVHQVIGVGRADAWGVPEFSPDTLGTVAHEYCHAFANPLVEAFADALEPACSRAYPFVAQAMERQAYGNWRTMMAESLVRASCTRFWPAGPEREAAIRHETEQRGFPWTRDLSDALGRYEEERERTPRLADFMPRLVAVMERWPARLEARAAAQEAARRAWSAREPALPPELEREVQDGLAEAVRRIEEARAGSRDESAVERVRDALRAMRFRRDAQVTVLDARGAFVFHVQGLTGSAYGHADVRGRAVYRELNEARERAGLARTFDFVSEDGASARANAIAWTRLDEPAWLVCVEGHDWQTLPPAAR